MINYIPRVVDKQLDEKLDVFKAVQIVGPKWCGKTTSAKRHAKSIVELAKPNELYRIKELLNVFPDEVFSLEKPLLIDEWQSIPEIYDYVRAYCDDNSGLGLFLLTGSTSTKVKTLHTGTGRISLLEMYPMSLYESGESNGEIPLKELFDNPHVLDKPCKANSTYDDLIFASCRGGWPAALEIKDKNKQLLVAKDYYKMLIEKDIYNVDDKKRNNTLMESLLKSYARNISSLAKKTSIIQDIKARINIDNLSDITVDDYIDILERLYIVDDIYGWCPAIRSKDAIRSGRKREFVDPSIAVAALNASPEILRRDLRTYGFIFENMCVRDLKIYSSNLNGKISYYRDKYDLECDIVLFLDDDRYALIEVKFSDHGIEEGSKNLCKLENLILEKINSEPYCGLTAPSFKMVLTGSPYGYKNSDGVYVVPIGCLKD